jgi:hypothetical protein
LLSIIYSNPKHNQIQIQRLWLLNHLIHLELEKTQDLDSQKPILSLANDSSDVIRQSFYNVIISLLGNKNENFQNIFACS